MRGKGILWLAVIFLVGIVVFAAGSGASLLAAGSASSEAPGLLPGLDSLVEQPVAVDVQPSDPPAGQQGAPAAESPSYGPGAEPPPPPQPPLPPLAPPASPGQPSTTTKDREPRSPMPAAGLRTTGGPDGGGYYYQDSGEPAGPVYSWVDISVIGTSLAAGDWTATGSYQADDEGFASIALPFAFPFYGKLYNMLYIDANGQVGFTPFGSPTFTGPVGIPDASYPNNRIDLFHADLDLGMVGPGGSGRVYYYHDIANQRFIVEYKDAGRYGGLGLAGTFEVILYANGDILAQYQSVLVSPIVPGGIENRNGSAGLSYGGPIAGGLAIGYYRPAVNVVVTPPVFSDLGGMAAVTATVRGRDWSPLTPPDGTTVTFNAGVLGTMSPPSAGTVAGAASSTVVAGGTCATADIAATANLSSTLVTGYGRATTGNGPNYKSGYLASTDTWSKCISPVVIQGTYVISPGVTLDIAEGTLVQFEDNAAIVVLGTLNANGMVGSPVLFTSSASQPTPGAWRAIVYGDNIYPASGALDRIDVSFGGRSHSHGSDTLSSGVVLYNTASSVNVTNSVFHDNLGAGVAVYNGSGSTIGPNTFTDNATFGVYVDSSSPVVQGNTISASSYGVFVHLAPSVTVQGNVISQAQEGIHVQGSTATVTGNTITYGAYGILTTDSAVTVVNNTVADNTAVGLFLDTGTSGLVDNNTADRNASGGLYARGMTAAITNNRLRSNTSFGAYLLALNSLFATNVISGNAPYGVYANGGGPTISGNTIAHNSSAGLYSDNATAQISGNTFNANPGYGLLLNGGAGLAAANEIKGSGIGGVFLSGSAASITGNSVWGNGAGSPFGYGIYAIGGGNAAVSGNTITGNLGLTHGYGVYASGAQLSLTNNTIAGNAGAAGNGYGVYFASMANASIVGGTADSNNGSASGNGYGVFVISSTGSISGTSLASNGLASLVGHGLSIQNSTFNVTNITASGNKTAGVYINPSNVTMKGSTIASNPGDGIVVWGGATLTLTNSMVQNNGAGPIGAGIRVVTSTLRAVTDVVSGNGVGVYLNPSTATLTNVTVTLSISNGLTANGSTLHLSDSVVTANTQNGVAGILSATLNITNTIVSSNGLNGIDITSGALLRANGITVTGNSGAGIQIDPSQASVVNSTVASNSSAGIEVLANSFLTVTGGAVTGNNPGIRAMTSTVAITSASIYSNTGRGLDVINSTTRITTSNVMSNAAAGIFVSGGRLTAGGSAIQNNDSRGVDVRGGTFVTLTNNYILYNDLAGVASGLDGAPSTSYLRSNTIYGNSTSGADDGALGGMDARGNWWGVNTPDWLGPTTRDVTGTVNITPWIVLKLSPAPSTIPAGTGTSNVAITMNDGAGNNVIDPTTVNLTSTLGSIGAPGFTSAVRTTSAGAATATYYAGTVAGTGVITGTSVDRGITWTQVVITAGAAANVAMVAVPNTLDADGVSTTTITATVSDAYGNLIDGHTITFTANSLLNIGAQPVTRTLVSGKATITGAVTTVAGTAVVTGAVATAAGMTSIVINPGPPATITLSVNSPTAPADGVTPAAIYADVRDSLGNPVADGHVVEIRGSGGVLTPRSLTHDDNAAGVAYSPGWALYASPAYYDGVQHWSLTAGATAVWVFTGTNIALLYSAEPDAGIANVTVDGVHNATIDMYNAAYLHQSQATIATGLSPATHTITVTVTGLSNPLSTGAWVGVDGFRIGPATAGGVAVSTITNTVVGTTFLTGTISVYSDTESIIFTPGPPYSLTLVAAPTTLPADAVSASVLTATVYDSFGRSVLDGTPVLFSTNLGSFDSGATAARTTTGGVATAIITSTQTGVATIMAQAGLVYSVTQVTFTPGPPYTITLTATPPSIRGDGVATSTICAWVYDAFNNLVVDGHVVDLQTSLGTLSPAAQTQDETSGVVFTGTWTAFGSSSYYGSTMRWSNVAGDTAAWTFTGTNIALIYSTQFNAGIAEVGVDGAFTTTVDMYSPAAAYQKQATIATGLSAGPHTIVVRVTGASNPSSSGVYVGVDALRVGPTTVSGCAPATLTSAITIANATLIGTISSISGTLLVPFTAGPPAQMTLTAVPATITADGVETSVLTATVKDSVGNNVTDGTLVTFTTTIGSIGGPTVKLTTNGVATATLSSTVSGSATVAAQAGSVTTSTIVAIIPGPPWTIVMLASPDHIAADGVSTATITATVTDLYGNNVADGTSVTFATSAGALASPLIRPTTGGRATIALTSSANVAVAYVTGTAGLQTSWVTVGFDVRVNAGGNFYLGVDGKRWAPDQAYVIGSWGHDGGGVYSTGTAIANTSDDPLYQSERWWNTTGSYKFTVPNGSFTVTLKFAEIYPGMTPPNTRVFHVAIEGVTVLPSYNVYLAAGGQYKAVDVILPVSVSDGLLNIAFTSVNNGPKVNAIEVVPSLPPPPLPTATPTRTPTRTSTATVTRTPTISSTPTVTGTPTPTGSPTQTNTPGTPTLTGTTTNTPTQTPTPTITRTPTQTPSPTPTVAPYALRVNAGGGTYIDGGSNVWEADQAYIAGSWGYVGGLTYDNVVDITNTSDDVLYQSERWWNGPGGYKFTVPNGTYSVLFKFAEIYPWARGGTRVFNVKLEGLTRIASLDVIVAAAGLYKAYDVMVTDVIVNDGLLDIDFTATAGAPMVNAIGINAAGGPPPVATSTPTPTPTATGTPGGGGAALYRVNAGGPIYTDVFADVWQADQAYTVGGWGAVGGFTYYNLRPIGLTSDDTLYQTERWWNGTGTYKFTVPNGTYNVTLRFAEIYEFSYSGGRVFDIKIENILQQSSVDVAAAVGLYNAYDLTFPGIIVSDGVLQIDLTPKTGAPKVSAIRIWQ